MKEKCTPINVVGTSPNSQSARTDQVIQIICEVCRGQVSSRPADGIQYHTAGEPEDGHVVQPIQDR